MHFRKSDMTKTSLSSTSIEDERYRRILASLASGAVAGALAKTVIAPLERTKIYFQAHPEKRYRIRGAVKYLRLTYKSDGFFSLWRGNSATMARVIPYAAVQFMAHEQYKRILCIDSAAYRHGRNRSEKLHFLAGSLAGVTGQATTYPLDRARAVMAVTKIGEYKNLLDVFRKIIADEGFLALYKGFTPTMLGVIPYAGVSFFTFEKLKLFWKRRALSQASEHKDPTILQRLLSGALAGLLGQTSSYPLDIVRRRMQTATQMGVSKNLHMSIIGTLLNVLRKEGFFRGWYKGLSMNYIKGPIAVGISFTTYDYVHIACQKLLSLDVHS